MVKHMDGNSKQLLKDCQVEIDDIKRWIAENKFHSNTRYLTAYAVVKASGTIEYVLKQMIFDRLSKGTSEETNNFLSKSIVEASYNPSTGQIMRILQKINSEWKERFELTIRSTKEKGQLNSLVELRNNFAHGSPITASINDVDTYFNAGIVILDRLWNILNPNE